jgi:hypothetical protein
MISIEVLAERIESLCSRMDHGFEDLKAMLLSAQDTIQTHTTSDDRVHKEIRDALEEVRVDVAVFKARWSILAVVGSAIVSGLISYLVAILKG